MALDDNKLVAVMGSGDKSSAGFHGSGDGEGDGGVAVADVVKMGTESGVGEF